MRVGRESVEVEVEDTPYTVKSVTIQKGPDGLPMDYILHLSDDTQESLSCRPLTVNKDNVLYCLVKGGSERARFLRAAYYQVCIQLHCDEKAKEYWLPRRKTKILIQPET